VADSNSLALSFSAAMGEGWGGRRGEMNFENCEHRALLRGVAAKWRQQPCPPLPLGSLSTIEERSLKVGS